MRKKSQKRSVVVLLLLVAILGFVVGAGYICLYSNASDSELHVRIDANTTYEDIVKQIRPALRSEIHRYAFDICAKRFNLENRHRNGTFDFDKDATIIDVVRKISRGDHIPVKLVVGTARTLPHLAEKLAKQIEAEPDDLLAAMRDVELRKELGFVKDSTIAMFIPNTYEVYSDITPEELMYRMHKEYKRFWNKSRVAKLERCGLSQYEVMTLAAIVYEETKANEEMAAVAGVYINRLRKNMRLQADPTVKYAIGDFAMKRVMRKYLKYDSPFNTYVNKGLPPAPICIPSIAAIDAVLNYKEHDYFYFCARPELDGRHNFARTLDEHNVNARKYADALNKQGIKK